LIFLTPQVAPATESLKRISKEEAEDTKVVPDAVGPGTFDDPMRAMNRGENRAAARPPEKLPEKSPEKPTEKPPEK
jgi:hypothetical protein